MFQAPGLTVPLDLDEAQVARITAPSSPTFDDVLLMLKLVRDPDAFQAKLDQLMAATVKADEAKRAMIRQQQANVARENEFEHWQKKLAERMLAVTSAEAVVAEKQQGLHAILAKITNAENVLKRELLRYAGISVNEALQQLPSFAALAQMVLGERNDAHFDNNQGSPRDQVEGETLPLEGRVPGSQITQSVSHKRQRRGN
jgi:hypothetical protein